MILRAATKKHDTLRQSNIAMGNSPFEDVPPIKKRWFSIAMLVYRRVPWNYPGPTQDSMFPSRIMNNFFNFQNPGS